MKVHHVANRDLELEVIWQSPHGAIPYGGVPAVATTEGEFYAGEIVGDELVAVDLLTSKEDATYNAKRRDWRHP